MLLLLSPAKKQDFSMVDYHGVRPTKLHFAEQAAALVKCLREYDGAGLQAMMGISEQLAELNQQRYQKFNANKYDHNNAKAAALAFQGDVYKGLQAETMDAEQLIRMQASIRILSGLYGLLRPMDLIQPYRLEMKTKFANPKGNSLYAFWGDSIAAALNQDLQDDVTPVIINLASQEYFKAVDLAALHARVVTIDFKVDKGQGPKTIGIYAKKARGMMAHYVVDKALTKPETLQDFARDGYHYTADLSGQDLWVFVKKVK